jgi:hypothetical protein
VGNVGTVDDRERWRLRPQYNDTKITIGIGLLSIPVFVIMLLGFQTGLTSTVFLWLLLALVGLSFSLLGVIFLNEAVFFDHLFMSLRDYPLEIRPVETAIGLLLASREARFDKEVGSYRLRTRMEVRYLCHDMDGVTMVVRVRPVRSPDGEWTQVRLLTDIKDEDERKKVEEDVDNAVARPFDLRLKKYQRSEEPELHMFEG